MDIAALKKLAGIGPNGETEGSQGFYGVDGWQAFLPTEMPNPKKMAVERKREEIAEAEVEESVDPVKKFVNFNNKQYVVIKNKGQVNITSSFDVIVPSTAGSVHPKKRRRTTTIDPSGKLGRKILNMADISNEVDEGYTVLPPMDKERYMDREHQGLEGPFRLRSGKVVYYDKREGKYYDSDSDLYMSDEDYFAHDAQNKDKEENPYHYLKSKVKQKHNQR